MKKNVITFLCFFFLNGNNFAFSSQASLNETRGSLSVFVYPPRYALDWTSPSAFAGTLMRNMLVNASGNSERYKSSLGHSILYLSCTDLKGVAHDLWSGLTGQNDLSIDRDNVFKKHQGLSVIFQTYRDGEILGEKDQRNKVANYRGRRGVKPLYLRLDLTPEQCSFLVEMEAEYRRRSWDKVTPVPEWALKPDEEILHYGFEVEEPLQAYLDFRAGRSNKLGGGCTSYASSFLKAVGFWDKIFDEQWTRRVTISEKLMGTAERPVRFAQVLQATEWSYPGFIDHSKDVIEPEFMWRFMNEVRHCAKSPSSHLCTPAVLAWTQSQSSRAQYFEKQTLLADRTELRPFWSKKLNQQIFRRVPVKVPVEIEGMSFSNP